MISNQNNGSYDLLPNVEGNGCVPISSQQGTPNSINGRTIYTNPISQQEAQNILSEETIHAKLPPQQEEKDSSFQGISMGVTLSSQQEPAIQNAQNVWQQQPFVEPRTEQPLVKQPCSSIPTKELEKSVLKEMNRSLRDRTDNLKLTYCDERSYNMRFGDIECPAHSAIKVEGRTIHANRVGGLPISSQDYIASQAPLPEDLPYFWQATQSNGVSLILDLTTSNDIKGGVSPYYPEKIEDTKVYRHMQVTLTKTKQLKNGMLAHTYTVINSKTNRTTSVKRVANCNWLDFTAVSTDKLKELIEIIEKSQQKSVKKSSASTSILAHCRAGVGRTGTLIASTILKEKIQEGEITLDNFQKKVVSLILELRKQRGPLFVQTEEQFQLVVNYAYSLLTSQ